MIRAILTLTLSTALLLAQPAAAAIFYVNSTVDLPDETPVGGECMADNDACTLRAAIMQVNAFAVDNPEAVHVIYLTAPGDYVLTQVGSGEDDAHKGDLDVRANILLLNETGGKATIHGNHLDRVFDIHPGASLTVVDIDITGGYANQVGTVHGGAFNVRPDASLALYHVRVYGNLANMGGAIYHDGQVSITDSEIFHNSVLAEKVNPSIANGAAIFSRGALTVNRSTFHNNGLVPGENLVEDAYAIYATANDIELDPHPAKVDLTNVTIANNTRGIYSLYAPLDITFSTIVDNADQGLVFIPKPDGLGVQLSARKTVLAGHTDSDCNHLDGDDPKYLVKGLYNASSDESCGFSGPGDKQNILDPFFGPLDYYGGLTPVMMPNPFGELVDSGPEDCSVEHDQRETPRPLDGNLDGSKYCDIGAVEYQPAIDPLPPLDDPNDPNDPSSIFSDGFEG